MTDAASKSTGAMESQTAERRTNEVLRSLVNEMLQGVRDLSRRTAVWSAEERAQAEREPTPQRICASSRCSRCHSTLSIAPPAGRS